MTADEMKQRTKAYALRVIGVVRALPRGDVAREIGNQLLRSGTSVGANYRAACRAKSRPDFINKLKKLTHSKDRHIKGHSMALLKRLQEVTDLLDNQ